MDNNILKQIEKNILKEEVPSIYIESIKDKIKNSELKDLFDLRDVEQQKEHHPEGNVWNHTMQVLDVARKLKEFSNSEDTFMLAALFHDIGKKIATKKNKKGKIIAYDHDKYGTEMVEKILKNYEYSEEKIKEVMNLVRYHMHHLYIIKDLPYQNTEEMVKLVDINDIILLFIADRLGRNNENKAIEVIKDIEIIINKLNSDYKVDTIKVKDNIQKIKEIYLNK